MEKNNEFINGVIIPEVLNSQDLTKTEHKSKIDFFPYWEKEYINQKINEITNPKHKMLMKYLWMSGLRITEAISLTKADIDFNNYSMRVKWLKNRKYNYRIVPIFPILKDLLWLFTAPIKENDRVFPITRQRAWQLVQQYLQGNPHKFRHSFAVNWLRCGGDLIVLHRILGHAKIQTTMEYLKIVPIDQMKELMKIRFE